MKRVHYPLVTRRVVCRCVTATSQDKYTISATWRNWASVNLINFIRSIVLRQLNPFKKWSNRICAVVGVQPEKTCVPSKRRSPSVPNKLASSNGAAWCTILAGGCEPVVRPVMYEIWFIRRPLCVQVRIRPHTSCCLFARTPFHTQSTIVAW